MKKYGILLFFCIMILLLLCGCSSGNASEAEALNTYERSAYTIPKEYAHTYTRIMTGNERKLLYYELSFEGENGEFAHTVKDIYEYDLGTGTSHKLMLSEEQKEYGYLYVFGDQLLAIDVWEYDVYLLDSERRVVAQKNLRNLSFPGQEGDGNLLASFSGMQSDGQYLYINGSNGSDSGPIVILGKSLEEKAVLFPESIMTMIALSEDRVGFIDQKEKHLYEYDDVKNELVDLGRTSNDIFDGKIRIEMVQGNSEYDYFYYTRNHRNNETGTKDDYFCGVKGDKAVKLFDFDKMGIQDLDIYSIWPDDQTGFWVMGLLINQEAVLYHFVPSDTPQDHSPQANKKCIKIGSMQYVDANTSVALQQFNLQSDDYYFETVVYQEIYEDIDIARTHLFLDCQENRLDGILLDTIENAMIRNDVLYDLNNYLEQSTVVSKEQFITHYWESVTDANGEIYALYPSFTGYGYAYEEKIDFSNLLQYENLCDEEHTFLSHYTFKSEFEGLLSDSGDRFVNEATGEIHIREAAFQNMLQFLKGHKDYKSGYNVLITQYCSGESKATPVTISDPIDYLYFNRLFHDRVVFSNVACDGLSIGSRAGLLGICKKSENKEALFQFFDFLYEPANYHESFFRDGKMPVLKAEYDLWKENFLATESYEDRYGMYHPQYDYQKGYEISKCIVEKKTITEQEAEEAISALQEIQYVKPLKWAYVQIITEDAADYFAGVRSLDEVCDSMENRLRIALEENKER